MINSHTHIFSIDHVPNKFARGILPLGLGHVITIRFLKRIWPTVLRIRHFIRVFKLKVGKPNIIVQLILWVINWVFRRVGLGTKLTLPGKENMGMIRRYLRLADFAFSLNQNGLKFNEQKDIFERLKLYYGRGTHFVVLTMDMEYMKAGKPIELFNIQLQKIEQIRKGTHRPDISPFLCIDPRRLSTPEAKGGWGYADYEKKLLEKIDQKEGSKNSYLYAGIKLYPALGYYPFDWRLLPIYQLAVKHKIPIMTHCTHGPVYYRGKWRRNVHGNHPFSGMELWKRTYKGPNMENFTVNFGHPLNYYVLTDTQYLAQYLNRVDVNALTEHEAKYWEEKIEPMLEEVPDLSQLKVCLAHWGGGEEWDRYLENHQLPGLQNANPFGQLLNAADFKKLWYEYSWFYIIRSLASDPNRQIYTDISFTLHQEKYLNLLKVQMNHPELRERILFGTDYYVVAHHETEREFSVDVRGALDPQDWLRITNANPVRYLSRI